MADEKELLNLAFDCAADPKASTLTTFTDSVGEDCHSLKVESKQSDGIPSLTPFVQTFFFQFIL